MGAAAGVRNWLGQPGASAAKRVSGYRESHSAVQAGFAVAAFQPGTDYAGRDREGRIIALVYNWWTIFMRLGIPDKHAEAITSRPLALHGIARQTRHGNQTTVEITSTHAKASQIAEILTQVSGFLKRIKTTAEQLTQRERWKLILSAAFRQFLGGKVIGSTGRLADATG